MDNLIMTIWEDLESIIALLALLLSAGSIWQQSRYNKVSVKPFCNIFNDCIGDRFYISIQNIGQGPLIVDNITYVHDNSIHRDCLMDCISGINFDTVSENRMRQKGIAAGAEQRIFEASFSTQEDLDMFWEQASHIIVRVKYVDTYNQAFWEESNMKQEYEYYRNTLRGRILKVFKHKEEHTQSSWKEVS